MRYIGLNEIGKVSLSAKLDVASPDEIMHTATSLGDPAAVRCYVATNPPVFVSSDGICQLAGRHLSYALAQIYPAPDVLGVLLDENDPLPPLVPPDRAEYIPPPSDIHPLPALSAKATDAPRGPSRPTIAKRQRIAAEQTCPVCLSQRGKTIALSAPKDWRKRLSASYAEKDHSIRCPACEFALGIDIEELRTFLEWTLKTADMVQLTTDSCPQCRTVGIEQPLLARFYRGKAALLVCPGRLKQEGRRICDYSDRIPPPQENKDGSAPK